MCHTKKDVRVEKPYSTNPNDHYLSIVLARVDNKYQPWVTWVYNKNDDGYFWGHYFERYEDALDDFNNRGPRTIQDWQMYFSFSIMQPMVRLIVDVNI